MLTTLLPDRYQNWVTALAFVLLPASFGFAILRHGLYDLDRLVSRAATYALFQPLRHVLQKAVDRRFNRARYDALAQVEDFAVRLRTPVSTEAIAGDLLAVVERTVQPASATLWLVRSSG